MPVPMQVGRKTEGLSDERAGPVGTDDQLYELKFDINGNPLGGGSSTKAAFGDFRPGRRSQQSQATAGCSFFQSP